MLLDEPLANLDYKLREELRDELGAAVRRPATPPWSTPPPSRPRRCCWAATRRCSTRASCCSTGRRRRSSTRPHSLRVARAFSDPPMNLMPRRETASLGVRLQAGAATCRCPLPAGGARKALTVWACAPARCGVRAARRATCALPRRGWSWPRSPAPTPSCTPHTRGRQRGGAAARRAPLRARRAVHAVPAARRRCYVFDAEGALLVAPQRAAQGG